MERIFFEIDGKAITAGNVKGQKNLFILTLDHAFIGYYDLNGKDTSAMPQLSPEEMLIVEQNIRSAIQI
jgi:hypothetical protein